MAGIYVHIPYCKQACHYCDFHFSTNLESKQELVTCLLAEIELQQDFLTDKKIETIYFGGGTPSLLSKQEIEQIIEKIADNFDLSQTAEITLEANPDDLTTENLQNFKEAGINRLSIGIQSFTDQFLEFFNRAHDATMAMNCVELARQTGIEDISIDLIYGVPNQSIEQFRDDLEKAIGLDTQHVSVYGLTIEEKTAFGRWAEQGKLEPLDETLAAEQFEMIMDKLEAAGYEQYEISNFCKPGFESRHNSSYWQGKQYLGIGPAAHSYDGQSRQFNVRNNAAYIKAITSEEVPATAEKLSIEDKVSEYLLTRLRTSRGIDIREYESNFNSPFLEKYRAQVEFFVKEGALVVDNGQVRLTRKGKLLADHITEKLI